MSCLIEKDIIILYGKSKNNFLTIQKKTNKPRLTSPSFLRILNLRFFTMSFCEKVLIMLIKFPCSWGVSGALYLQSATAGVISCLGLVFVELPFISGVDVLVSRNRNL